MPWKKDVTYFKYVSVALGIQHAMRMRRILLSFLACLAIPYFSTSFHTRRDFRKKKIDERNMCSYVYKSV